jgi:hypothetical protein
VPIAIWTSYFEIQMKKRETRVSRNNGPPDYPTACRIPQCSGRSHGGFEHPTPGRDRPSACSP